MMIFSNPSPYLIVSDTGFSVEFVRLSLVKYTEAERAYWFDASMGTSKYYLLIWAKRVRIDREKGKFDKLDLNEERRIIDNIRAAYSWAGKTIEVDDHDAFDPSEGDWQVVHVQDLGEERKGRLSKPS